MTREELIKAALKRFHEYNADMTREEYEAYLNQCTDAELADIEKAEGANQ